MKAKMLLMSFLLSLSVAHASNLEGDFVVKQDCADTLQGEIPVLFLRVVKNEYVEIKVDQAEGVISMRSYGGSGSEGAWPLSNAGQEDSFFRNAKIKVTPTEYSLSSKGSEWGICDEDHFPYPCQRKWNESHSLKIDAAGNLQTTWSISGKSGSCTLHRVPSR